MYVLRGSRYKRSYTISRSLFIIITLQVFLLFLNIFLLVLQTEVSVTLILIGIIIDFTMVFLLYMESGKIRIFKFTIMIYLLSTYFMMFYFAVLYSNTGVYVTSVDDAGDTIQSITTGLKSCFYFSVITWTSLGYGDTFPSPEAQKWVMLEVFVGYFHMAVFVGFIMENMRKPELQYRGK